MVNRNDLIAALKDVEHDKRVAIDAIRKCPEEVDLLLSAKDNDGNDLFRAIEIDDILVNCRYLRAFEKDAMSKILSDPQKVAQIAQQENRAYEFGLMLGYGNQRNSKVVSLAEITASFIKDSSRK